MGYSAAGLRCIIPRLGGSGPALWYYSTTDAHTDVDADDYFTDAGTDYGVTLGDAMIVVDTDSATCTLHSVRAAVTAGDASINVATLA